MSFVQAAKEYFTALGKCDQHAASMVSTLCLSMLRRCDGPAVLRLLGCDQRRLECRC